MTPTHAALLSPFAAKVVMASLKGRIQTHLNRPPSSSDPKEASAAFWKSHREIDNILLNMAMHLPPHLRIPAGSSNPNIIHMNQGLHSCVIIIHQAAIARARDLPDSEEVKVDSWGRCLAAAKEISSIMKRVAHLDLSTASLLLLFLQDKTNSPSAQRLYTFCFVHTDPRFRSTSQVPS